MKRFFLNIALWFSIKFKTTMFYLSVALHNTEVNLLKADPNDLGEKNSKIIRHLHSNQLLEKFYAGQGDEKYTKDYYELLKKADKFMRESTDHKKEIVADRNAMSLGVKDKYGRRQDHVGFYQEGHKHAGKTMGEVLKLEMEERRTKDDDYELLFIADNKPIVAGLSKIDSLVDSEFSVNDLAKKSKTLEFPINISRKKESINKIEQVTEFLHIKKIGLEHRQLEFFIPQKYKLQDQSEKSKIFKELIKFQYVYIKNDYGETIAFKMKRYMKNVTVDDRYIVLKFHVVEMEQIKY